MKKLLALILFCACVLGAFSGCGNQTATPTEPPAQRREDMPNQLLVSDVNDLPTATDDMTYQERRQLILDTFELQLRFQWVPNMDVTDWQTTNYKKGTIKNLLTTEIYGGIPYQSKGNGNLYRWLEYYDENTGVFDIERAFAENGGYGEGAAIFDEEKDANGNITYKKYRSFATLFNQCSVGAFGGWGRVINSASFGYTNAMNVYNGFIPVGCYAYGYEHQDKTYDMTQIDYFGVKTDNNPTGYDIPDIISGLLQERGRNGLYDCYAMMKPADCLVNTGHVIMVKSVDIVRWKDGSINPNESKVVVLEQWEAWGQQTKKSGQAYKVQGGINTGYSFATLQEKNYIPFTFAELLDPADQQDKKHLDFYDTFKDKLVSVKNCYAALPYKAEDTGAGIEPAVIYSTLDKSEGTLSFAEFKGMSVAANYGVSDVFVIVRDKDGNQLLKNIHRTEHPKDREVSMLDNKSTWEQGEGGKLLDLTDGVKALAGGENTIEISVQLTNGDQFCAFHGALTQ